MIALQMLVLFTGIGCLYLALTRTGALEKTHWILMLCAGTLWGAQLNTVESMPPLAVASTLFWSTSIMCAVLQDVSSRAKQ